mmetsp:Transcript_21355/g.51441  ORF Transcript_21355/g.51441 Transcript_21355/m.51441 type:complete len:208 (-) Transcript_21355:103-726(-)
MAVAGNPALFSSTAASAPAAPPSECPVRWISLVELQRRLTNLYTKFAACRIPPCAYPSRMALGSVERLVIRSETEAVPRTTTHISLGSLFDCSMTTAGLNGCASHSASSILNPANGPWPTMPLPRWGSYASCMSATAVSTLLSRGFSLRGMHGAGPFEPYRRARPTPCAPAVTERVARSSDGSRDVRFPQTDARVRATCAKLSSAYP